MSVRYEIALDLSDWRIEGFEAVDFCRRHGLDERGVVQVSVRDGNPHRRFDVDEAFAREWFTRHSMGSTAGQIRDYAEVDPADALPGELTIEGPAGGLCLSESLSPGRARELFVKASKDHRELLAAVGVEGDDEGV